LLGRKIRIFHFCQAVLAISYSLSKSQKSTKAAALVALVVMTPLYYILCIQIQNERVRQKKTKAENFFLAKALVR
jgi:uncharacterized membrane protein